MTFNEIFEQQETKALPEIGGTGTVYRHRKTGARIFCMKNDDRNKVFLIGFRTTPKDSTGVAHIMEHSVLCGSEKFPIKDPFVELAKGSLNTFLNAMTYPDKTVYPVASVNETDFMNLMDVYLDAVFHPKVYQREEIFRQEGWHYELDQPDGELIYNGVVYNEMKGAFSDPNSVLERYTMHALFPDTTYGFESGGDPEVIPELSYEAFLNFHRFYYHPSNAYICLYGDMDMEEKLMWIEEHYLKDFAYRQVDSSIALQAPHAEPVRETRSYAVSDGEDDDKCYLSKSFVLGDVLSNRDALAWQILDFVLLQAPGAPLTEALIKAGMGEDIYGGYTAEVRQPYFSVIAKNAPLGQEAAFEACIRGTLEKLVREGIDRNSLKAALNYTEFKLREEDFGVLPKGLGLALQCFQSWLYDGSPFTYLFYEDDIRALKELAEGGFFEEMIRSRLLENSFAALVSILLEKGMTARKDGELREKLAGKLASLSAEEREALVSETAALKAFQSEQDSEEDLKKLPVLKLSDIDGRAEKPGAAEQDGVIYSDRECHGIAYIKLLLDTRGLSEEELQYASCLTYLLGQLDTASRSYKDLSAEILMNTGGISFAMGAYGVRDGSYRGIFSADIRVLEDRIPLSFRLLREMLFETSFADGDRIYEKLMELRSRAQMRLDGASHTAAVTRAGSYMSPSLRYTDLTDGVAFMDFLDGAAKLYKTGPHGRRFIASLEAVLKKLLEKGRVSFALCGSSRALEAVKAAGEELKADFYEAETDSQTAVLPRAQGMLNEGLKTSSQVSYIARTGNFRDAGLPYDAGLDVLRVLLNYEYLWFNIRVKGGAYGCMSGFARNGRAYLVSYRDPRMKETNAVYEALPEWLEQLELTDFQLTKYIIGAISVLDHPRSASIEAQKDVSDYIYGMTAEDMQRDRDQILSCSLEKLRSFAAYIRAVLDQGCLCTIGNAEAIEKNRDMYRSVRELY